MGEKKHSENGNDRNTQINGVMITVYVESSTTRSRKQSDPAKKSKRRPQIKRSRTSQSQGYDRRALLLAYSRQLRNAGSECRDVRVPSTQKSRHKSKEENCSWFQFCPPSSRMLRRSNGRWTYDRVPFVEKEELNQSRKKKSNGITNSPFLRKLKGMLKEMSCKKITL
ncbi:uncharacterized protein LOC114716623 [Neltuma alba]|uniref:uncharacterized protein LOC114716614 n=1 Tax=Neltuma alba TaxID=207710 RepID=UPI0010A38026|nr:uncharacterized protein LOC114716614 [Prosopis alba]XP_028757483.1 uncharacterized protein LOC114716623 [Prosopis alba]